MQLKSQKFNLFLPFNLHIPISEDQLLSFQKRKCILNYLIFLACVINLNARINYMQFFINLLMAKFRGKILILLQKS